METQAQEGIRVGILVGLKSVHNDPDVAVRLRRWIGTYGRGPFLVCGQRDHEHVSLEDRNGKVLHFGSTADPSLHIGYVEKWKA